MAFNYVAYARDNIKNVYPGYLNEIWVAPKSWFTVLQEPVLPGVAAGDTVKITTAHTFPVGKGFVKLHCQPDSVQANASIIGPKGAKRPEYAVIFNIQGDSPELLEMMKEFVNEDLIVIAKDATCPGGQLVQFGCDCTPVNVSEGEFTSSNTGEDDGQKAWALTADAYCKYFYNAAITEKPAA